MPLRTVSGTSDTLVASDMGTAVICTNSGTTTLGTSAAASLGAGWWCEVRAQAGVVNIDPNSSEQISFTAAATTGSIQRYSSAKIVCDGTQFFVFTYQNGTYVASSGDVLVTSGQRFATSSVSSGGAILASGTSTGSASNVRLRPDGATGTTGEFIVSTSGQPTWNAGLLSLVNTATTTNATTMEIGSFISVVYAGGDTVDRNTSYSTIRLHGSNNTSYCTTTVNNTGNLITGTWRCRGIISATQVLMERVS